MIYCFNISAGGESYSTPKECRRSRECTPRKRVWTNGNHVRCLSTSELGFPANGTRLPFRYAVLEVTSELYRKIWRRILLGLSVYHIKCHGGWQRHAFCIVRKSPALTYLLTKPTDSQNISTWHHAFVKKTALRQNFVLARDEVQEETQLIIIFRSSNDRTKLLKEVNEVQIKTTKTSDRSCE